MSGVLNTFSYNTWEIIKLKICYLITEILFYYTLEVLISLNLSIVMFNWKYNYLILTEVTNPKIISTKSVFFGTIFADLFLNF